MEFETQKWTNFSTFLENLRTIDEEDLEIVCFTLSNEGTVIFFY